MRRIVDVGGGDGEVLKAILTANDAAEGVLIDQPSVVESTRLRLESASVADRMSFASGSFFNQMPDGGDGYVLSDVMIDFGDEEDVRILRQCRSAMAADGRILVVERVVPEGPSPSSTNESSDEPLSVFTRRTEREFQELYRRAGFVLTRVIPTATPQSILEGVPA